MSKVLQASDTDLLPIEDDLNYSTNMFEGYKNNYADEATAYRDAQIVLETSRISIYLTLINSIVSGTRSVFRKFDYLNPQLDKSCGLWENILHKRG